MGSMSENLAENSGRITRTVAAAVEEIGKVGDALREETESLGETSGKTTERLRTKSR